MRVLVGGATGYLGRHLAGELKSRGHTVRGLARGADRLSAMQDRIDEIVVADATDRTSLRGCCDGVDVVLSAIGIMGRSRNNPGEVDLGANLNLLEEARAGGVRKFIYTSVLQRPGMEKLKIVRAKRAFEQELQRSGIPFAVLRPNGFFSDMDQFLAMAVKGRAFVFGGGRFEINPIDGADVARVAADAIDGEETLIEFGGPELLTYRRVAEAAFAAVGKPVKVSSAPVWVAHALLALLRHLTPARVHAAPEFVLTVLSHDMIAPGVGEVKLREHFLEAVERERTADVPAGQSRQ